MSANDFELSDPRWTVTTGELAVVLGIQPNNIDKLVSQGMPKRARGQFYLPDVVQWAMAKRQPGRSGGRREVEQRIALQEAQEDRHRLVAARMRGELVPVGAVRNALATLTAEYVDALEALPGRASQSVEVQESIRDECNAIRRELSDRVPGLERAITAGSDDTAPATEAIGLAVG